jgi:hypothetical protein
MKFELLPIIDTMLELYQMPRTPDRFQKYLKILRGPTKDDLVIPVSGFNPMAKEHIVDKLNELKTLHAELLIAETLIDINKQGYYDNNKTTFKVCLNVCDDLMGGWTNHFTTDFETKFRINALVNRHFCTPIFWSSEPYDAALIKQRTWAYALRTIYWQVHPKPNTLQEHCLQELFVIENSPYKDVVLQEKISSDFYIKHSLSSNYHLIFNFFYGDVASNQLGFPTEESFT